MERFQKYVDAKLNIENVKNSARLESLGIRCTYLPEPVEDFDEFEFAVDCDGKENIILSFAVENGKIKRLMIVQAAENDPDTVKALSLAQLESFLAEKGEKLLKFFDFITSY